jgi:hypothetical protein
LECDFANVIVVYLLRTFLENLFLMSSFQTDVNFKILNFFEN